MIAHRRRAGFTLVELMIGVSIIAILSALMAPELRRTMLEHRQAAATRDFVRMFREARNDALGMRRAHLVVVNANAGTVRVLRGRNNSCLAQDWAALNDQCDANEPGRNVGTECFEMQFNDMYYTVSRTTTLELWEMPLSGSPVKSLRSFCYAPNGQLYHGTSLTNATNLGNGVGGGFLYLVSIGPPKDEDEDFKGGIPDRQVLVPLNGQARMVR